MPRNGSSIKVLIIGPIIPQTVPNTIHEPAENNDQNIILSPIKHTKLTDKTHLGVEESLQYFGNRFYYNRVKLQKKEKKKKSKKPTKKQLEEQKRIEQQKIVDKFNEDQKYHIILLSTKATGLGLTITGGNRIISRYMCN